MLTFKEKQQRNRNRQKIYDACKRARNGEQNVYITIRDYSKNLYRVKLHHEQPIFEGFSDTVGDHIYAYISMYKNNPTLFYAEGKDWKLYRPNGSSNEDLYNYFKKNVMAVILKHEDVHKRENNAE